VAQIGRLPREHRAKNNFDHVGRLLLPHICFKISFGPETAGRAERPFALARSGLRVVKGLSCGRVVIPGFSEWRSHSVVYRSYANLYFWAFKSRLRRVL
jgi:hypothetical protein